ncbi:MAG: hypothetical protein V4713_03950 [Pseudomonadota bacterium]
MSTSQLQPIGVRVEHWYCNGMPEVGLSNAERGEVIADAQGSFLAEHVGMNEKQLMSLDDHSLVSVHYSAMVDATR